MHTEKDTQFNQLFQETSIKHDFVKKARHKAWERFLELGQPVRGDENFQYMQLKNLFAENFICAQPHSVKREDFAKAILPECQHSYIVFVNGYFQKELSDRSAIPSTVVISSFDMALRSFNTFLTNAWTKAVKEEKESFALLNAARYQDGIFVYIPPKIVVEAPLQIISLVQENDSWVMPKIHLFQGALSELVFINTIVSSAKKYFYNQTSDLSLEEGAKCTLIQDTLSEPSSFGWIFDDLRVEMKRHAEFQAFQLHDAASITRRRSVVMLQGEASEARIHGLAILSGEKELHTSVTIDHQAPLSQSHQYFKGVITDKAHSSFQGKIMVRQQAQKTEAYQLNNNLLLSDQARANSKPNLEIFADDVKASHGATVGKLDEEELFYLKSRGFSETVARKILIKGFCEELIEKIPLQSIRTKMSELLK